MKIIDLHYTEEHKKFETKAKEIIEKAFNDIQNLGVRISQPSLGFMAPDKNRFEFFHKERQFQIKYKV